MTEAQIKCMGAYRPGYQIQFCKPLVPTASYITSGAPFTEALTIDGFS